MVHKKKYNRFYNIKKRKPGVSIILLVFSLLTLLGLSALVVDLGIILNQRYEMQKAVESAALLAASEYELYYYKPASGSSGFTLPAAAKITDSNSGIAAQHYQVLKNLNQVLYQGKEQSLTVTLKKYSKAVRVEADFNVPTYFIGMLGVTSVQIQAKAAAVAAPVFLSSRFPKPGGSIVNGEKTTSPVYKDTHIRAPLAGTLGDAKTNNLNYLFNNIYGKPDGKALSLGPGGFITIRLPEMVFDGKGFDFIIYERGHAEGYFVYAGVDTDPSNPYLSAQNPGGGINWINVSCTGVPLYVKPNETIGAYKTTVTVNGSSKTDYKFYGSGMFDLGMNCGNSIYNGSSTAAGVPRIKNVKYLKIIDDNAEDGFFIQPKFKLGGSQPSAIPMLIPGEHSSLTPGADIDAVEILHHSRLISLNEFEYGDGATGEYLLNVVENMYGLNNSNINNFLKREGYNIDSTTDASDTPPGSTTPLPMIFKDYFNPDAALCPPTMEVQP